MTPEQLAAIRAYVDAATVGPWKRYQTPSKRETYVYAPQARYDVTWAGDSPVKVALIPYAPRDPRDTHDAEFITRIRTDAVSLLDEVERLRAALEHIAAGPGLWPGTENPAGVYMRDHALALQISDEEDVPKLRTLLASAREALFKVSTRSATGVDEANYPIQKFPSTIEMIKLAQAVLTAIDASGLLKGEHPYLRS